MAKLTSAQRNALASNQFALPKLRKYPIHDKAHARSALGYSSQHVKKGNLSFAQHKQIIEAVKNRYGNQMKIKAVAGNKPANLSLKSKSRLPSKTMVRIKK